MPASFRDPRRCRPVRWGVRSLILSVAVGLSLAAVPPDQDSLSKKLAANERSDDEWHQFDPVRFTTASAMHLSVSIPESELRQYLFFPPVPPVLGADIPMLGALRAQAPAPEGLSAFVADWFYPRLASRVASGELPTALRRKVIEYRAGRDALEDELRARLTALADAEPSLRARELSALAAAQAPRLAAMEAQADKLRDELRWSGVFGKALDDEDWGERISRYWGRQRKDAEEQMKEAELVEAAAFLDDGLSVPQRELLREWAIASLTTSEPQKNGAGRMLFLGPSPARIPLPEHLPETLAARIEEYETQKAVLQGELIDVLRRPQGGGRDRAETWRRLWVQQAPRWNKLQEQAEEIRAGIATLPALAGPAAAPALPADLQNRIDAYQQHKVELLKTLHGMLANSGTGRGADAKDMLVATHEGGARSADKPVNRREVKAAFDRRQAELFGALNQEKAAIREALSQYVRTLDQTGRGKSVDDLLKDFESARQRQELWARFAEYRAAVLQPGLSTEQRRLLFAAAVEQLALPLPAGQPIP